MIRTWFVLLLFLSGLTLTAQSKNDSIADIPILKNPKKAALLSALLPGAGQVYNHSKEKGKRTLWKLPIIYAGLGTCIYFLDDNTRNIKSLRTEYLFKLDNPNSFQNPDYEFATAESLRNAMDTYKNWRDISIVSLVGVYVLQIVDASVDAHLFNHDVSPNISMSIEPSISFIGQPTTGLSLKFRPKHTRK